MTDLTAIYRNKSPSTETKMTLACIHLLIIFIAAWLLFGGGINICDGLFGRSPRLASGLRRGVLMTAAVLYFLRTLATIFVFLKRRMRWSEVAMIATWLAVIEVLFAYFGGRNEEPFGLAGWAGVVLVLVGSAINSGSELQRHLWKRQLGNSGHLYTGGLFRYARHINYFGDEVLFTGWTLMTGEPGFLIISVLMMFGFLFVNVPALDRYLESHYGDEYRNYARTVKRFIPYVY